MFGVRIVRRACYPLFLLRERENAERKNDQEATGSRSGQRQRSRRATGKLPEGQGEDRFCEKFRKGRQARDSGTGRVQAGNGREKAQDRKSVV